MTNEGIIKIDLKILARLLTIGIEHMPDESTTKHDVVYAYSFASMNTQYECCKLFTDIASSSTFKIQGDRRSREVYCKDVNKLLKIIFAGNRVEDIYDIFTVDDNFITTLAESLDKYPIDFYDLYCKREVSYSTLDDNINEMIELTALRSSIKKYHKSARFWYSLGCYDRLWTSAGKNYYKIEMGE